MSLRIMISRFTAIFLLSSISVFSKSDASSLQQVCFEIQQQHPNTVCSMISALRTTADLLESHYAGYDSNFVLAFEGRPLGRTLVTIVSNLTPSQEAAGQDAWIAPLAALTTAVSIGLFYYITYADDDQDEDDYYDN